MSKMKIVYHEVSTWDFDRLTLEEMIENLKSNIETEKLKLGVGNNTVVRVCDIDKYCIRFRIERPMTEEEIISEETRLSIMAQREKENDRRFFEQLKAKHGW